jgi:DNA polymerase elongation subunit (family B)
MSTINFFPIRWFESDDWKSIQVIGQLENQHPVYIRIGFKPYFTIRYDVNTSIESINDNHEYLRTETPIAEVSIMNEEERLYRVYVINKEDYYSSINFYNINGLGTILDEIQDIKSKFFAERKINPGSWQQASDLRTLIHNVTMNSNYTSYDLEFYTKNIISINLTAPIPQGRIAFFDIEVISSDNVSFPDAESEHSVDNIFAISLVDFNLNNLQCTVYVLTEQDLPQKYTTSQSYNIDIIKTHTEKELIQKFFDGLVKIRPNRLVSMNGRHFDLNYIGTRAKNLGIEIPSFTPILSYKPYFYPETIVKTEPFSSIDKVLTLSAPSISQIDLLDFYRRLLPQLGNHKLETLSQIILKRGKTGLTVQDMFNKYRSGTPKELLEIIEYSIIDSILLYDLWTVNQIDQKLAIMANEWKNDSEYVLTHDMDMLFDDLIHYIQPNIPDKQYKLGKPISIERKSGIHRNVYIYSLSSVYLMFLQQLQDPLAVTIATYFSGTNDGIIPFSSGYFSVKFSQVQNFIMGQVSEENIVWIEKNSFAVTGKSDMQGPVPLLTVIDYAPLIVISHKSWILVNQSGMIFKKGLSYFVRPPFLLLQKYIDYLLDFLIKYPDQPIVFPNIESTLEDFVLENKVTAEDFVNPKQKLDIIQQLRELNTPIPTTWRKVYYIKTTEGNIIEEIYSKNPDRYIPLLDKNYYNKTLQNTLKSVFVK